MKTTAPTEIESSDSNAVPTTLDGLAQRLRIATKLHRLAAARKMLPLRRLALRKLGIGKRPRGVNLVGYTRAEMGLGTAVRGIAAALDAVGEPFNIINLEAGNFSRHGDTSWAHKEAADSGYDVTVVGVHPDNSYMLKTLVPLAVLSASYVINIWYWELPELPDEWGSEFAYADEIWVGSRFVQDAVSLKSPVPVVRVPPAVRADAAETYTRDHFGLPGNRFLFLAMFDTHSVLERKNPLAVLRAYRRAFPEPAAAAGLVLKFNNPNPCDPIMRSVAEHLAGRDDIFVINGVLSRDEVISLMNCTDCFVSLHRSEGFGLGPAEAMYLGKPAIMTNWSGNTDYMTCDNSAAVDYRLVPLGTDYGPYNARQLWAEPDEKSAARWMRRLFEEPQLASEMGQRGREIIRTQFSSESSGRVIARRLEYVRRYI
ncbi:MAG: glycosyltransferase family 4 protein [Acidobacteriota bacterium]|nr:glycosyltransferase family 4 protein [Acidobacteriota bacterium]